MEQPEKIDFGSLPREDLEFFRNGYMELFLRVSKINEDAIRYFEELVPEDYRQKMAMPETTGKKIGLVLKKLLINTGLTFFTGTDPMYLDTGVEIFTRGGRYKMYKAADPAMLSWSACMEMRKGLDKAMDLLKTDSEEDLVRTLNALETEYADMQGAIKDNLPCYAINWAIALINNLKVAKNSLHDKIHAIYKQRYNLGITVNPLKGFSDLHEAYRNRSAH